MPRKNFFLHENLTLFLIRYIALFAARKEKGVGAKKHSKGKKNVNNHNDSEGAKREGKAKEKKKLREKQEMTSLEVDTTTRSGERDMSGSSGAHVATSNENVSEAKDSEDEEEFETTHRSISTKENISSTNGTPEAHEEDGDGRDDDEKNDDDDGVLPRIDAGGDESDDSDVIDFDRRMSSSEEELSGDDLDISGADDDEDDDESDNDDSDEGLSKKPGKTDATKPAPVRNRAMVVTRLNLDDASSEFLSLSTNKSVSNDVEGQDPVETNPVETDDKRQPSATNHSVDPFFMGARPGQSSVSTKRKWEEEEHDEEDFQDRFSTDWSEGGGDLTSSFVSLRGDQRQRGRGRGDGARGLDEGRDRGFGGGRGRGFGGRGRGLGDRGGRGGRFSKDGSSDSFPARRGRGGGGGFDRGRGFGRGGAFRENEKAKTPSLDESALHPSWQAKRKQKLQISSTTAQSGKKITFDD